MSFSPEQDNEMNMVVSLLPQVREGQGLMSRCRRVLLDPGLILYTVASLKRRCKPGVCAVFTMWARLTPDFSLGKTDY
jgi:hypothetical protein